MIDRVLSIKVLANTLFYAAIFFRRFYQGAWGKIKESTAILRPPKLKEGFSRTAEVLRARYGMRATYFLGKRSRNGKMGKTENEKP
jgi:hypothetical protein